MGLWDEGVVVALSLWLLHAVCSQSYSPSRFRSRPHINITIEQLFCGLLLDFDVQNVQAHRVEQEYLLDSHLFPWRLLFHLFPLEPLCLG